MDKHAGREKGQIASVVSRERASSLSPCNTRMRTSGNDEAQVVVRKPQEPVTLWVGLDLIRMVATKALLGSSFCCKLTLLHFCITARLMHCSHPFRYKRLQLNQILSASSTVQPLFLLALLMQKFPNPLSTVLVFPCFPNFQLLVTFDFKFLK